MFVPKNSLDMNFQPDEERLFQSSQIIALPDKNGLNFIEINSIIRCHSDNSYTEFFIRVEEIKKGGVIKRIVVSKGMEHFENILTQRGWFFRIHNQHLVNIRHIRNYMKNNGGYLIMDDNTEEMIPVARARKEEFIEFLKQKGIII